MQNLDIQANGCVLIKKLKSPSSLPKPEGDPEITSRFEEVENLEYLPRTLQRTSVIQMAAEEICRLIDRTRLRSGDPLPPETRLSEMLGLSRNSIREALRMLHGLGVVEKTAGRSCVVATSATTNWGIIDEARLLEAAEAANEVRSITMQRCVELAARRLTAQDHIRIADAFAEIESASAKKDRTAARRAHDLFYGLILTSSGNTLLAGLFRQANMARLTALSWPAHKTFVAPDHLEHHRNLLNALLERDGAKAMRIVRHHYTALGKFIRIIMAQSGSDNPQLSVTRKRKPHSTSSKN